jgi:hypothetical protein
LTCSASAVFADANRLLFGENPAASPSNYGTESLENKSDEGTQYGAGGGGSGNATGQGTRLTARMIRNMDAQHKKDM